ncbi:MAG: DUF4230 domain-containing protein [Bacteroidales bacterium]|nr:DUF4230 domain-containing protein [Bacteroidales bacterium]MBN2758338.1 DUF4230 domain-containing protein [Bacteroidales bacterium]
MALLGIVNFIRKYWFIFLLIVVYIVFSLFNLIPQSFNIFKKKQLLIDETPVLVKEVKEIGELTTSEFYGEVYTDLNEVYDEIITNYQDSLDRNRMIFYEKYKGLESYIENYENFRANELIFKSESEKYDKLLTDFISKTEEFKNQEKEIRASLSNINDSKEEKNLKKRLEELTDKYNTQKKSLEKVKKNFKSAEEDFFKQKNEFRESKKKRNLVYIGRGWVKAGVELKNLDENDIIIDEDDSLSIHIIINNPIILDADINPWFIYTDKRKVQGFELFISKTGSLFSEDNFTDDEITAVKDKCKLRLKEEAINKGLLKNAKKSATSTLENFFHLVGFEKVTIRFKEDEVVGNNDIDEK